MDANTQVYRVGEIEKIGEPSEYRAKIQIRTPHGKTNWLSVTNDELVHIKAILTN